jgi:DEAD/DEAH box helicase domain-containing protein
VDGAAVATAADRCIEALRNEIGGLRGLDLPRLTSFMTGFLALLKTKGGVFWPDLDVYIEDMGGWYRLGRTVHLPAFGSRTRTPVFLSTKGGTRFDTITARGTTRTWYQDWARRCFQDLAPGVWDYAEDLYRIVLGALVDAGVLATRQVKGETIWGLRSEALLIGTEVHECRCTACSHTVSAGSGTEVWEGMRCLRIKCEGSYAASPMTPDYYGQLYSGGDIQRTFPAEHTALLDRARREEIEIRFGERQFPWDPNLLSCTPTLEMGIDIGDLSSVILCSVPPSQASYLQRVGRTGRRDGNSFNLTLANGRPHDLYFYAQPLDMMAGDVEPPGCFLSASAVLARQFTAFCFDRWVETGLEPEILPGKLGKVLGNLTAKGKEHLFPFVFLAFIERQRTALLEAFEELFPDLPATTATRLRAFVEGGGSEHPGVRVTILQGLEGVARELDSLRKRIRELGKAIKRMEENPVKDSTYQEELEQLEIEHSSLRSIAHSIVAKDTFNFFTDEGLLPNYAFPEAGVLLRSVILRRRKREEGRGKFLATVYEYERPGVSAIHELAPSNRFYAEGRKVSIDQVDMRLSEIESWRFCDRCPQASRGGTEAAAAPVCPNCGSPTWSDADQVRHMIKMRQVMATTKDRDSRIQDDSDDREPEFFNKMMMAEVPRGNVEAAWRIDSKELPFGFEFVRSAVFREVNFGNRNAVGDSLQIANRPVPKTGFTICRFCGKVEQTGPRHDRDTFQHAISCPSRKNGGRAPLLDCIYLYREFASEAIRILLPMTTFAGGKRKLQSFIAAIVFGLKRRFHGNIDHLEATTVEEPIPDNESIQKQYLLLYDKVPGGTGYLQELVEDGQAMMDLFADTLQALRDCGCRHDPKKDGCYRCLYGYRSSFDMPDISRSVAMDLLADILAGRDKLVATDTVTTISQNTFIESELEAHFIEALHRTRHEGQPTMLRKEIVHHRTGWYCMVGGHGYYVAPQVELGPADGVPIPTRPDFMLYPEHERETRPIAVYLDGFTHHADPGGGKSRVGDDTAKRMGLIRSGRYWVWSLTWNDVMNQFEPVNAYFPPYLKEIGAKEQKLRHSLDSTGILEVKGTHAANAFRLLVEYMAAPDERAWRANAWVHMLMCMELRSRDVGRIRADIAAVEEKYGLPLGQTADPAMDDVASGALHEDTEGIRRMDLLAWTRIASIQSRNMQGVEAVCSLDDIEVEDVAAFRRSWNGFLRLFCILQFLPGTWFVTAQGRADGSYLPLEFTGATSGGTNDADGEDPSLGALAEVVEPDLLAALGTLARNGVVLPDAETVPFELRGEDGEVLAEAEMAWEDRRVVLVYADDEEARIAFAAAGWATHTVEELVSNPDHFMDVLKAGDRR